MANIFPAYASQQHITLARYLMHYAWLHRLDGVFVDAHFVRRSLNISRLEDDRLESLKHDVREWFPFVLTYVTSSSTKSSILFSRHDPNGFLPLGRMSDKERIKNPVAGGPKFGVVTIPDSLAKQRMMHQKLDLLSRDLISLTDVFSRDL